VRFALDAHTSVKVRQDWIVASGRERGHVKAAAQSASSTKDGALAADRAAVVIKRRQASERGGLPAIELTELGHLREQERSCARAHSANRGKFLCFSAKGLVLRDQTLDACIEQSNLLFDFVDQAAASRAQLCTAHLPKTIFFSQQDSTQVSALSFQFTQALLLCRRRLSGFGLHG
jgi:hypothetical protein